jgi:hypothetical protein
VFPTTAEDVVVVGGITVVVVLTEGGAPAADPDTGAERRGSDASARGVDGDEVDKVVDVVLGAGTREWSDDPCSDVFGRWCFFVFASPVGVSAS